MRDLQRVLLLVFLVFALATVVLQFKYGMICGRSDYPEKQDDPKAKSCRKKAGFTAGLAAASLAVCLALGVMALH